MMKLLMCSHCKDVFNVNKDIKKCLCRSVQGKIVSNEGHVEYKGEYAILIQFDQQSVEQAILTRPNNGFGSQFDAYVVSKNSVWFKEI